MKGCDLWTSRFAQAARKWKSLQRGKVFSLDVADSIPKIIVQKDNTEGGRPSSSVLRLPRVQQREYSCQAVRFCGG